jgi:transposase
MSLKPQAVCPVPQETARVARAAYPKGNIYMQMRDMLGSIYTDEDFAGLFPKEGQPTDRSVAFSPDHRAAIPGAPV